MVPSRNAASSYISFNIDRSFIWRSRGKPIAVAKSSSSEREAMVKSLMKHTQIFEVSEVPAFSKEAESNLQNLFDQFNMDDALKVKEIEKVTNDSVEVVEYLLKQICWLNQEISKVLEFFHFTCTSQQIDDEALALMLNEALDKVILPAIDKLITKMHEMGIGKASYPIIFRTLGQVNEVGIGMLYFISSEIKLLHAWALGTMRDVLKKDMTVSTILGYIAEGFARSLVAYKSTFRGNCKAPSTLVWSSEGKLYINIDAIGRILGCQIINLEMCLANLTCES